MNILLKTPNQIPIEHSTLVFDASVSFNVIKFSLFFFRVFCLHFLLLLSGLGPTWVNDLVKRICICVLFCVLFCIEIVWFIVVVFCFVSCNLHSASSSFIACLNIQRTAFIIKRNERHIMRRDAVKSFC